MLALLSIMGPNIGLPNFVLKQTAHLEEICLAAIARLDVTMLILRQLFPVLDFQTR